MSILNRKKREQQSRTQQILVAASRTFCEKGYRNATIIDIAKEAELSPGTIYLYFKNKEHLFFCLTEKIFTFMNMRLKHIQDDKNNVPIDKRIEAIFNALVDAYEFNSKIMVFTIKSQGIDFFSIKPTEPAYRVKKQVIETIVIISELILNDQYNTESRRQARKLAHLIWSHFTGVVLLSNILNTPVQAQINNINKSFRMLADSSFVPLLYAQRNTELI